jgi:hypothetical protein
MSTDRYPDKLAAWTGSDSVRLSYAQSIEAQGGSDLVLIFTGSIFSPPPFPSTLRSLQLGFHTSNLSTIHDLTSQSIHNAFDAISQDADEPDAHLSMQLNLHGLLVAYQISNLLNKLFSGLSHHHQSRLHLYSDDSEASRYGSASAAHATGPVITEMPDDDIPVARSAGSVITELPDDAGELTVDADLLAGEVPVTRDAVIAEPPAHVPADLPSVQPSGSNFTDLSANDLAAVLEYSVETANAESSNRIAAQYAGPGGLRSQFDQQEPTREQKAAIDKLIHHNLVALKTGTAEFGGNKFSLDDDGADFVSTEVFGENPDTEWCLVRSGSSYTLVTADTIKNSFEHGAKNLKDNSELQAGDYVRGQGVLDLLKNAPTPPVLSAPPVESRPPAENPHANQPLPAENPAASAYWANNDNVTAPTGNDSRPTPSAPNA